MAARVRTHGNRPIRIVDTTLNRTEYPAWTSENFRSQVAFTPGALYLVSDHIMYNVSKMTTRIKELITRVNSLISYLNHGWVQEVHDAGNGSVGWSTYPNTGLSTMSFDLS